MTTIVIMPGGFHPFHAGHYALYQSAQRAFPDADVYVAATNDTSARPFPFPVKEKLAKLAGVEAGHFVQVKSPFKAEEITARFNPNKDTLIFVRSEKDSTKPPQPGGVKKDGSPGYLQPLLGATKLEPFAKHAYMAYLPTVEFGPGMTSATEIRTAWPQLDERRKTALVMSLYPRTQGNAKLATTVVKLLDTALDVVDESALDNLPRPNKRNQFKSLHKQRKQRGLDEQGVAEGTLEEINRRGFLKGAGAAAASAAAGKAGAKGIWASIPMHTESDPPLPRTVKWAWNYFSPDVLSNEDKTNVVKLINLLYFARMAPDNWRDSQNGRIIGNVLPSEIYKKCYELLIFINDSFRDLDFGKAMNDQKSKIENLYKNDPAQFKKLQEFFFSKWETIVLMGKLLEKQLTKKDQQTQQVEPDQEQKRRENLQRMQRNAAGPSRTYADQIVRRIKPNIVFMGDIDGNPRTEVEIRSAPDGTILSRRITQSSGNEEWDKAVLRAIDRSVSLPKDTDGYVPPVLVIGFRPNDINEGVTEIQNSDYLDE
jgi:glycerol-3-phosphate cytidylyltransferase-like family protein